MRIFFAIFYVIIIANDDAIYIYASLIYCSILIIKHYLVLPNEK